MNTRNGGGSQAAAVEFQAGWRRGCPAENSYETSSLYPTNVGWMGSLKNPDLTGKCTGEIVWFFTKQFKLCDGRSDWSTCVQTGTTQPVVEKISVLQSNVVIWEMIKILAKIMFSTLGMSESTMNLSAFILLVRL